MNNTLNFFIIFIFIFIFINYLFKYNREHFGPNISSPTDISEGASEYWGWGFQGINDREKRKKHHKRKCPKCEHVFIDDNICNIIIDDRHKCKNCDITKNKDIDKYVLKSSIPPCPDMSKFATKAMVKPCPDINKYVLKSKLPEYCEAYWPNNDKYILKSKCKPKIDKKYKIVYNDITKHPQFNNYISKENCKNFKKSWIQNFDEWWESLFGNVNNSKKNYNHSNFPKGYSFSPYSGFGIDNPGYGLSGNNVS
jgi:hypothetical protein